MNIWKNLKVHFFIDFKLIYHWKHYNLAIEIFYFEPLSSIFFPLIHDNWYFTSGLLVWYQTSMFLEVLLMFFINFMQNNHDALHFCWIHCPHIFFSFLFQEPIGLNEFLYSCIIWNSYKLLIELELIIIVGSDTRLWQKVHHFILKLCFDHFHLALTSCYLLPRFGVLISWM